MNRKQFEDKMKTRWGRGVIAGKCVETASPQEEIPPRRVMLRGALAVGCGLLVPSVLLGCDSKKSASPTSSAPDSSPVVIPDSAAPATAKKLTQASVQYQTQPKGEQKCSTCINFVEPNACKLVEGPIIPDGWCSLWAKKA